MAKIWGLFKSDSPHLLDLVYQYFNQFLEIIFLTAAFKLSQSTMLRRNNQDFSESCLSHLFLIANKVTKIKTLIYPMVEHISAISYFPGCSAEKMKNTKLIAKITKTM